MFSHSLRCIENIFPALAISTIYSCAQKRTNHNKEEKKHEFNNMFTTKSVPQRITQPTQLYYTRSCDRKIEIIVFGKQRGTFFFPLYIFMCDGRALTQLNGVAWWAKGLCHATIGSPHFPQFFSTPATTKKRDGKSILKPFHTMCLL